MPRPRSENPRNMPLKLYFTVNELASIKSRAEALGMRPVHFGRSVLLAKDQSLPQANYPQRSMGHVLTQLSRLGNNLNQMVRHLHATGDPLPADLEPLLADIRALLAREIDR